MTSTTTTVAFLIDFEYSFTHDNLLKFKFDEHQVSLTMHPLDNEQYYISLRHDDSIYHTEKISSKSFEGHFESENFSLKQLTSKDSLGIEYNQIGCPEIIAFYINKSRTRSYLTLDLNLMSQEVLLKTLYEIKINQEEANNTNVSLTEFTQLVAKFDNLSTCIQSLERENAQLQMRLKKHEQIIKQIKGADLVIDNFEPDETQIKIEKIAKKLDFLSEELAEEKLKTSKLVKDYNLIDTTIANLEDSLLTQHDLNQVKIESINSANESSQNRDNTLDAKITQLNQILIKFEEKHVAQSNEIKNEVTGKIKTMRRIFNFKLTKLRAKIDEQLNVSTSKTLEFSDSTCVNLATLEKNLGTILCKKWIPNTYNCLIDAYLLKLSLKYPTSCGAEYRHNSQLLRCLSLSTSEYAVSCDDGTFHFRNKNNHQITKYFPKEHTSGIFAMIIVENQLATGGSDKIIKVWNLSGITKITAVLEGHAGQITSLVHVIENVIASGGKDNFIILWDLTLYKQVIKLSSHTGIVTDMIMLNQQNLMSASLDKTIRLWSTTQIHSGICDELEKKRITSHFEEFTAVCRLSDSHVVAGSKSALRIWNAMEMSQINTISNSECWIVRIEKMSPTLIASSSQDSTIKIWNFKTLQQVGHLKGHTSYVNGIMRLNRDQILSISSDATIRIWESSI